MKTKDFPAVKEARKIVKAQMSHYRKIMNEESKMKMVQGNILDLAEAGEFDIVVQGCNCFNTMGGGIAREIRERYPEVAGADLETIRGDYNKLGTWTEGYAWFNERAINPDGHPDDFDADNFIIINAYTQYDMSTGEDVFEYTAFELILQKLLHEYGRKRIGFPRIGMGLAGGDENRIMAMLEKFASQVDTAGGSVTLVEFK